MNFKEHDRKCTYKRDTEARSRTHFCRGKAISNTYSECVSVALVIQHAKGMHRIILSPVPCLAVPYFSTLSHKRYDLQEQSYQTQKARFYFLYNVSLKHFSF